MRTELKEEPISWIVADHRWPALIDLNPPFQREGGIWSPQRQRLLIDSILRGWDVPKFYFRETDQEDHFQVVDGKQRLEAIYDFYKGNINLGQKSNSLPDPFSDLSGKTYEDFTVEQKDKFLEKKLSIVILRQSEEAEVRELFERLQEGVSLNPQERRNAKLGELRDFIAENAGSDPDSTPHKVFERIRNPDSRYQWDDLLAVVTCLEIEGQATDVGAVSLRILYDNNKELSREIKAATNKVLKNLNFFAKVIKGKDKTPEMKNKWGFTDLYLLISMLHKEGWNLLNREDDLQKFFIDFEAKRLANSSPEKLESLAGSDDWRDKSMFEYINAFQKEGAKKKNVEARHNLFMRLFIDSVEDLETNDRQRSFTEDQRIVLWRRADMKCQNRDCQTALPEFNENVHGDHIIAFSNGGPTSLANGQCLCGRCNRQKGNR